MNLTPARSSGQVEINGTSYYYEDTGQGYPVVLLHSGLANLRMWDAQVEAWSPHFRVIAYDLPGFGLSATPRGEFSTRADLVGLLRHLRVERAAFVGSSLGGSVAIDLAIEYPDLVGALVLAAPGLGGNTPHPSTLQSFAEMEEAGQAGDWDRVVELELRLWIDGPGQPATRVDPTLRELIRAMNRENVIRPSGDATPVRLNPPAIERLGEIRARTLVLVGDRDVPDILDIADRIEAGVPGARKVVFPEVAHLINLEQPELFNQVVLEFLSGIHAG